MKFKLILGIFAYLLFWLGSIFLMLHVRSCSKEKSEAWMQHSIKTMAKATDCQEEKNEEGPNTYASTLHYSDTLGNIYTMESSRFYCPDSVLIYYNAQNPEEASEDPQGVDAFWTNFVTVLMGLYSLGLLLWLVGILTRAYLKKA